MVDISHSRDSDLDVFLIAPDGQTRIELFTNVGESGSNFEDTVLDDEASVSITTGSAPFTGSYRPEGSLAELIGQNIYCTWTLEITDDTRRSSGTLNSWSLIANLADTAYYSECANDIDFDNIFTNSGWITTTRLTFTELDQTEEYWYRVKARPLNIWFQTSQEDFTTDVLTDTETTGDGDVVLPTSDSRGGDNDTELHVIADPSFESDTLAGWSGDGNGSIFVGGVIENMLWASDGDGAGIVLFNSSYYYDSGDWGALIQPVDWTGVDTLVFDYASFGYANLLIAEVYIGDTKIWSRNGKNASNRPNYISAVYDVKKDVSSFEGVQNLSLVAQPKVSGWFDAGILWDNLRTYGPGGGVTYGGIVSSAIGIGDNDTWHVLTFNATIPAGTELTIDVLPAEGMNPIPGYVGIPSGTDLSGLNERIIRLRANLSTGDPTVSPMLHDWSISYTDAACESDWSNVVSSSP
jgi:subtilisin-like proprotein convertase family protein